MNIIQMAVEAGLLRSGEGWTEPHRWGVTEIERFAALVIEAERNRTWPQDHWTEYERRIAAIERNKIAVWMMERGYATGHGDTVEDLLTEIEWQVREACAHICETAYIPDGSPEDIAAINCAKAIRKRGEK